MADRKLSASTELAEEPASGDLFPVLDISDATDAATGTLKKMLWSTLKAIFAVAAKGVTNGDTHDHAGGDGAQVDHGGLGGLADDDHTQYILHSLATAANDFLVASGSGAFVKKTLAEVLTILGKAAASGLASLDGSSKVVQDPANATAAAAAGKIPISDGSGKLDTWISDASDAAKGKVELATAAETTSGTDTARAVTPDGLAGSDYGKRIIQIKVMDDSTVLTTGEGKIIFCIPACLNGFNLVAAHAFVTTVSSSGLPEIAIRNVTDGAEMLSMSITIDVPMKIRPTPLPRRL
jgi:hypothetical protein